MPENDRPSKLPPAAAESLRQGLFGIGGTEPPKSGRFKQGQSGNPRGRPRRKPEAAPIDLLPFQSLLLEALERPVSIRDGSKVSSITSKQAVIRSLITSAMKGSAHAQKIVLEWLNEAERDEAMAIAREHAVFEDYRAHWQDEIAKAERQGLPVPQTLPHPDDVVIRPGKRVRFDGPTTPEQALEYEHRCKTRDAFIMQDALDRKLTGEPGRAALLAAWCLNEPLPKRMQLSESMMQHRMLDYDATSKRHLLKIAFQTWRGLGFKLPRGWVSPPAEHLVRRLKFGFDLVTTHASGKLDLEAMCRREFDEEALALMERHGVEAA